MNIIGPTSRHWTIDPHLFPAAAAAARAQIEHLGTSIVELLPDAVAGLYVHGSLALGSFNPARSDIDLLVVLRRSLTRVERHLLVEQLLTLSLRPHPIEISFLTEADLRPWRFPTPYDLHYSEAWRDRMMGELAHGSDGWWMDEARVDPDLAAHITVTRARGIGLLGPDPRVAFPEVPAADYLASLAYDIEPSLRATPEDPVYSILNACRTLAYVQEGQVLSKREGGQWALRELPSPLHRVVRSALDRYDAPVGADPEPFDPVDLERFVDTMRQTLLPQLRATGSAG